MDKLIKYLRKKREVSKFYSYLYKFFSKKYYWYEVKFTYRQKQNSTVIFDYKNIIGLKYQETCLNKREIKKIIIPLHKTNGVSKYLCNGVFDCEIISFLGYFPENKNNDN